MVAAELGEKVATTTIAIDEATDRPPGCPYYNKETQLCAESLAVFVGTAANVTGLKINNIPDVIEVVRQFKTNSLWILNTDRLIRYV